jgi:hypothetical protein
MLISTQNTDIVVPGSSSFVIDSTDNPETDYPVCPICSRPCDDKPTSVACDICNSWLHYECENITPEEETKLDDPGIVAVFPDSMSLYPAFVRYCPKYSLILLLMSLNVSL